MRTRAYYYHSLRFKITLSLLLSVIVILTVTSYLRYASFRQLLTESLTFPAASAEEIIEAQMVAYVRSRFILSVSTIVVIVLISDLMMSRMVVSRLKQFLSVVKRISPGNLDARVRVEGHDEIAELAQAFNRMTEELQRQNERLSTLNTLAATVGQSLNLKEVLHSALDEVLELTRLRAGWITLRDEPTEKSLIVASRGLPEGAVLAHAHCAWIQGVCAEVFQSGRPQVFHDGQRHACPAAEYLQKEGLVFRACVPLKSKDLVLGVMSLVGVASGSVWMFTEDSLDTLMAIGRQIGVAIENARLYEELQRKETLRRQLLERGITLQEEERGRIARELHDQIGQRLTSIIMTLGVLEEATSTTDWERNGTTDWERNGTTDGERACPERSRKNGWAAPEAQAHIQDVRDTTAQILKEVRDMALHLRPSVLDDLGLLAALRHYLKGYQNRARLLVDFQALGLDGKRLPPEVETALFRIAQEALTNVARHAEARSVTVLLEQREASAMLIVEDDGKGFDVARVVDSRPDEGNLGIHGMRERAALLGGTLTIESTPGRGTTVFVRIPLEGRKGDYEQNPAAGGG
jgi:signal transduction histidine kinase/HAMP domain-containing protein